MAELVYAHVSEACLARGGSSSLPMTTSDMLHILEEISTVLNFFGSLALARGLFISRKQAIDLGVSRFSGDTDAENLKLPAVQDKLNQRKYAIIGASLLSLGLFLQLVAILLS